MRADRIDVEVENRITAKRAAAVLVHHNGHILMGIRKDTGKWTLPGGHLEPGETATMGAMRELKEETGHKAIGLAPMNRHDFEKTKDHAPLEVHTFSYRSEHLFNATGEHDPDSEVSHWEWIDTRGGLPRHVLENLQHQPNLALQDAGLYSSPA